MSLENWQVLVVEDERDSLQMISKILTHHGAQVHVAGNGFECVNMLQGLEPTIIISDLAMPEMDGWETLEHVRANPQTAAIPMVAVTAYHSVNVAQDAIQAGFDAYYSKPLDAFSFIESLMGIVEAKS